ncbi:hypothetical protein [Candidatus Solincola tengchongensis]|nr:hypothetical protein [Candidatus Solincola tengchongensis]
MRLEMQTGKKVTAKMAERYSQGLQGGKVKNVGQGGKVKNGG